MKIALPIASFHIGNTGEYMKTAFEKLGHSAVIMNQAEMCDAHLTNEYDLFFCIDSGVPLSFDSLRKDGPPLAMWFIDFRHNKSRTERTPNDLQNEAALIERNGFIFQAQHEDFLDSQTRGARTAWLPVAADPDVWSDAPQQSKKNFHIGFVGNVWDIERKSALEALIKNGIKVGFPGHGGAWKEQAAEFLRASLCGFNISSFFGTPVAYDINMRFFETLSCGIPLITNWVPSLPLLMPKLLPCIRTYKTGQECLMLVREALQDKSYLSSGALGRKYILENATYVHRAEQVLSVLKAVF